MGLPSLLGPPRLLALAITSLSWLNRLRQWSCETIVIVMTPTQTRMARAALKWSLTDLAVKAAVGRATVARFELGDGETSAETIDQMRKALAAAGAEFTRKAGSAGVPVPVGGWRRSPRP